MIIIICGSQLDVHVQQLLDTVRKLMAVLGGDEAGIPVSGWLNCSPCTYHSLDYSHATLSLSLPHSKDCLFRQRHLVDAVLAMDRRVMERLQEEYMRMDEWSKVGRVDGDAYGIERVHSTLYDTAQSCSEQVAGAAIQAKMDHCMEAFTRLDKSLAEIYTGTAAHPSTALATTHPSTALATTSTALALHSAQLDDRLALIQALSTRIDRIMEVMQGQSALLRLLTTVARDREWQRLREVYVTVVAAVEELEGAVRGVKEREVVVCVCIVVVL